jgi:hypothetical protein
MAYLSNPSKAWLGLVGFVIVSDAVLIKIKDRTMSSAFRDAIHHPRRRWPVSISWALLTLHLFTRTKYDPISIAGRLLAAKTPGEVS